MTAYASMALSDCGRAIETGRPVDSVRHGEMALDVRLSESDLWILIRRGKETGGLGWRVPLFTHDVEIEQEDRDSLLAFSVKSSLGQHRVMIDADDSDPQRRR